MKGGKGTPKLTNPGIINGSKPQTKGGKPATGAGKSSAAGKAATKISKVK